jgi:hypothetical protein
MRWLGMQLPFSFYMRVYNISCRSARGRGGRPEMVLK